MKRISSFSKKAFNNISPTFIPFVLTPFGLTKSFGKYAIETIFLPYLE